MAGGGLAEAGARPPAALRYRVDGMDCPSCSAKIETAVGRVEGTGDIRVNYGTQTLAFRLDESTTPRATVEEQVRNLGYGIALVEALRVVPGEAGAAVEDQGRGSARQPWWRGTKARLTAAIGALATAGFAVSLAAPSLEHWAYLPAALLGLAFFGRKAVAAA